MRSDFDSCSRAVRSTESLESARRGHVNLILAPVHRHAAPPNPKTTTFPARSSSSRGYLASYAARRGVVSNHPGEIARETLRSIAVRQVGNTRRSGTRSHDEAELHSSCGTGARRNHLVD